MYAVRLSIAPSTPLTAPASAAIDVAAGIIRKCRIVHPSGCADLVGVWLTYRTSRLYPLNDNGFFVGSGTAIEFTPNTVIAEPPFVIMVNGYNLDDTYTHVPTVTLEMEFSGSASDRERGVIASLIASIGIRTEE